MTLFEPDSGVVLAILDYLHCTDSAWGPGNALILLARDVPCVGIFTSNQAHAQILAERLTRHLPEFQEVSFESLVLADAQVEHTFDGERHRVVCRTMGGTIEAEWREPFDCKQVVWPGFLAGDAAYDPLRGDLSLRAGTNHRGGGRGGWPPKGRDPGGRPPGQHSLPGLRRDVGRSPVTRA